MGRTIDTHGLREVGCGPRRPFWMPPGRPEAILKNSVWAALREIYFLTGIAIFETVMVSPVISPVNSTV